MILVRGPEILSKWIKMLVNVKFANIINIIKLMKL